MSDQTRHFGAIGGQPAPAAGGGGDLTDHLINTSTWTDADVANAGIPVQDTAIVSIGGGLGSLALVDFLRTAGMSTDRIRVLGDNAVPVGDLRVPGHQLPDPPSRAPAFGRRVGDGQHLGLPELRRARGRADDKRLKPLWTGGHRTDPRRVLHARGPDRSTSPSTARPPHRLERDAPSRLRPHGAQARRRRLLRRPDTRAGVARAQTPSPTGPTSCTSPSAIPGSRSCPISRSTASAPATTPGSSTPTNRTTTSTRSASGVRARCSSGERHRRVADPAAPHRRHRRRRPDPHRAPVPQLRRWPPGRQGDVPAPRAPTASPTRGSTSPRRPGVASSAYTPRATSRVTTGANLLDQMGGTNTAPSASSGRSRSHAAGSRASTTRRSVQVQSVEPSADGDGITTTIRSKAGDVHTIDAQFIIDGTGLLAHLEDHRLMADLLAHSGAGKNPKGRLDVERHFEIRGTANGEGRMYASGLDDPRRLLRRRRQLPRSAVRGAANRRRSRRPGALQEDRHARSSMSQWCEVDEEQDAMTPTLLGRIQTRIFLLATVGVVWMLIISPIVRPAHARRHPSPATSTPLGYRGARRSSPSSASSGS